MPASFIHSANIFMRLLVRPGTCWVLVMQRYTKETWFLTSWTLLEIDIEQINEYTITNTSAIKGKLECLVRECKRIYSSLGDEGRLDQDLDRASREECAS